nr:kinesin-like protein KIF25 isoform X1 [Nerophis lumbriciformis]
MPLFVNRDQVFAHQVHLLEHKLRTKEERILELETENAILHIRLTESLGKLHQEHEENTKALKRQQQEEEEKKITCLAIGKLISDVQALKQCLSEVFAVYVSFATELDEQSKQLQKELTQQGSCSLKGCGGNESQNLQAQLTALEHSLEEERVKCNAERQRRKDLHNTLVELRGNIRVHCRVRPLLPFDHVQSPLLGSGPVSSEQIVHAISDDTVVVNCMKAGVPAQSKMFEFERVHGPEDSQETVFEEIKPLLTSVLDGYNVCIMAYGQTGSGKTHTMMGSPALGGRSGLQQGVILKASAELFRLISEKPASSHTVEMSVIEVYNNDVLDLLSGDEQANVSAVHRRESVSTSCSSSQVSSLTQEPVSDTSDVMHIMSRVLKLRAHCPTLVHSDSSRSHLIVTLTIFSKSPNVRALARRLQSAKKSIQHSTQERWSPRDDSLGSPASSPCPSPSQSPCTSPRLGTTRAVFKTKLQFVDLAGSECVDMTGVSGPALWEVSCINRSLSALSDVLGALAEQRSHIPYRNSKLTHLLKDAIGGDAKLLVMLCVSPTQRYFTESLQTLGFGARARQVQRDPSRKKSNTLKVK